MALLEEFITKSKEENSTPSYNIESNIEIMKLR